MVKLPLILGSLSWRCIPCIVQICNSVKKKYCEFFYGLSRDDKTWWFWLRCYFEAIVSLRWRCILCIVHIWNKIVACLKSTMMMMMMKRQWFSISTLYGRRCFFFTENYDGDCSDGEGDPSSRAVRVEPAALLSHTHSLGWTPLK